MSNWLPWALCGLLIILLAAMPWRRVHPNHEFVLQLLRFLENEDAADRGGSFTVAHSGKNDIKVRLQGTR
jgi:hypothetical protein